MDLALSPLPFPPGEYETKDGQTAIVKAAFSCYVEGKRHDHLMGYIGEWPVGWTLDGQHLYGGNVFPGTRALDLFSKLPAKSI